MGGGRNKATPGDNVVENEIQKAGGFGRFQWFTTITMILAIQSGGYLLHGLPYLELYPVYWCVYADGTELCNQTPQQFCKNPDVIDYYPDYDYDRSLHNLIEHMDLTCVPKSKIGLLGTIGFAGAAFGCFFVPRLGDLYGRKPVYVVSMILQACLISGILLSKHLLPVYILSFCMGPCVIGRMSCGFFLMVEVLPRKWQPAVGACMMIAEGSCILVLTFYFTVISPYAYSFMWFTVAVNGAGALLSFTYPESPRYLFGVDDFDGCTKALEKIARINGVKDYKCNLAQEYEICVMSEVSKQKTENENAINMNDSTPLMTGSSNTESSSVQQEQDKQVSSLDDKDQFNHLMSETKNTRFLSVAQQPKENQRQSVLQLHDRVSGIRLNAHLSCPGLDKTHAIALDDFTSMKAVNRVTKNATSSRHTNIQMSEKEVQGQEEEYSRKTEAAKKVSLFSGNNLRNLILMCICWFTTTFNGFMLHFQLKYIPGNIFVNMTISAIAEVLAHAVCACIFSKIGPKITFVVGFSISAAGGACLAFIDHESLGEGETDYVTPVFVLLARFGISLALCSCYVSTPWLFPTIICSTAYGICNIVGRSLAILAPSVAEIEGSLPMLIYAGTSAFAGFTSLFIKTKVDE